MIHSQQRIMSIQGDNEDEDAVMVEVHKVDEMVDTLKTGMIRMIEEPVEASKIGISTMIEVEVKKTRSGGDEDSGMEMIRTTVTEIREIEIRMVKVILIGEVDGMVIEARDIVIMVEGENGILIHNIKIRGTNNHLHFKTLIIIVPHLWVTSTGTQYHMSNTHTPSNHNIHLKCHQPHHNKPQIFANCAKIKAIMIINANLQVTLWPTHRKCSIKATHITIMILIKESGLTTTMTTMTQMGNLFSSGGS